MTVMGRKGAIMAATEAITTAEEKRVTALKTVRSRLEAGVAPSYGRRRSIRLAADGRIIRLDVYDVLGVCLLCQRPAACGGRDV